MQSLRSFSQTQKLPGAGLTETQAQADGRQIKAAKFPRGASGRAITLDRPEGMTKCGKPELR